MLGRLSVAKRWFLSEANDGEALREIREQLARLANGLEESRPKNVVRLTLEQLCLWWFETKAFKGLSSARDRKHNLTEHALPVIGQHTQDTLTSDAVEAMLEGLREAKKLAPGTLNQIRAAVSKVINDASRCVPPRWTAANPTSGVAKYEEGEKEPPMLTPAEAARLLDAADPKWAPLFAVAIYLGPRAGEIRGIRMEDLDLVGRRLSMRRSGRRERMKAGAPRTIPYPDELHPYLEAAAAAAPKPALFGLGGLPLTKNWKSAALMRRTLKRAGLATATKMTFHDLRHVSATLHQEADCSEWVMSKVLGHSRGKVTTRRYTHLSEAKIRAELSRLTLRSGEMSGDGGTGSDISGRETQDPPEGDT